MRLNPTRLEVVRFMMTTKTYTELTKLSSFLERFNYLKLSGSVGFATFGGSRWLNQTLYQSQEWKRVRKEVILRDNGCDLGCEDSPIPGKVYIHHLNPITKDDILKRSRLVFDPENLICCSFCTHNAIHYSDESIIPSGPIIRMQNDTCPWR